MHSLDHCKFAACSGLEGGASAVIVVGIFAGEIHLGYAGAKTK